MLDGRSCPVCSRSWKLLDESPLLNGANDLVLFFFSSVGVGMGGGGIVLFLLFMTVPIRLNPLSLLLLGVVSGTMVC